MTLDSRWKSGRHVGLAAPTQTVRLRRGVMDRHYAKFEKLGGGDMGDFGFIQDSNHHAEPWHAFWRNTGDWIDLPNVSQVDIQQDINNNGIASATITVENVIAKAYAGVAGAYHAVKRGYLSPLLGFAVAERMIRRANWSAQANEWLNVLNGGYRVQVEQGYGDQMDKSFAGLIDDTDITVSPDTITITARDFGQFLTDQRVFGSNKAKEILPPVIFQDRLKADNTKPVGSSAKASDFMSGHPATAVLQKGTQRQWISDGSNTAAVTRWVEITLPKGRYDSFWLFMWGAGASMYISMDVTNATVDGESVPDGWIDRGLGDVPGDNGGVPFVKYVAGLSHGGMERKLPFEVIADKIVLRLHFRNIPYWPVTQDHRIGVARLAGYWRKRSKEAKKQHWILVNDAADVVRWVLMWAGFHEWEVEDTGVRLAKPLPFHSSDFLIDIINFMKQQGEFVFYMKPPSGDDDSIGVPVFRRSRVMEPKPSLFEVTDKDVIMSSEPKWTKESLSYIIRVRGRATRKYQPGGTTLGEDRTERITAEFLPPWSGAYHDPSFTDRLSGLRKHRVVEDTTVTNYDDAVKMCVLIAIQEALSAYTMTVTVPGNPHITPDEHLGVLDGPSGVNSKLWLANLHSTFTTGTQTEWKLTAGGALVDTPDMNALVADYLAAGARANSEP